MRVFKSSVRTCFFILVASLTATAQDSSISIGGATLGFIQDGTSTSIRPILGIPGAAVFGPNLELPADIHGVTISPRHDYAIGVRNNEGDAVIVRLSSGATLSPIAGAALQ